MRLVSSIADSLIRIGTASVDDLLFDLLGKSPRNQRFKYVRWYARVLKPFVRLSGTDGPFSHYYHLDGYREKALHHAISQTRGLEFDLALSVSGADAIGQGGAIIIGGHFLLNVLFARWLFDRGHHVSAVIDHSPGQPLVPGSGKPLDVIKPDQHVLIRIRRRLREGGIVLMSLDWRERLDQKWRTVDTPVGPRYVSDSIMRFAERAGFPVLFLATRVARNGKVVATVARPSSTRAAVVFDEFCDFLRANAQQIRR